MINLLSIVIEMDKTMAAATPEEFQAFEEALTNLKNEYGSKKQQLAQSQSQHKTADPKAAQHPTGKA